MVDALVDNGAPNPDKIVSEGDNSSSGYTKRRLEELTLTSITYRQVGIEN